MTAAKITALFENAYPDRVVPVTEHMTVPVPETVTDEWWDKHFWPLTGTGRSSAPACLYSVRITESTVPALSNLSHEF